MPSDALRLLSDDAGDEAGEGPQLDHSMPEGVIIHEDVDWGADDPCATLAASLGAVAAKRQCVAATKAGARCTAPAIVGLVLCSVHSGRLDPAAGGKARAASARLAAEEAQDRMITARMGTRAVVAEALREKHVELRATVHQLADRAAAGDRQCALALLPFMTQALGAPAPAAPSLVDVPGEGMTELRTLTTAQLQALLSPSPPQG